VVDVVDVGGVGAKGAAGEEERERGRSHPNPHVPTSRGAGLNWGSALVSSYERSSRAGRHVSYALTPSTLSVTARVVPVCCARDRTTPEEGTMRRLDAVAGGLMAVLTLSGCANMTQREWGT